MNTSYQPGHSLANARWVPSGDHTGLCSWKPGWCTSVRDSPLASSTTWRLMQLRSSWWKTVYATCERSGDTTAVT